MDVVAAAARSSWIRVRALNLNAPTRCPGRLWLCRAGVRGLVREWHRPAPHLPIDRSWRDLVVHPYRAQRRGYRLPHSDAVAAGRPGELVGRDDGRGRVV